MAFSSRPLRSFCGFHLILLALALPVLVSLRSGLRLKGRLSSGNVRKAAAADLGQARKGSKTDLLEKGRNTDLLDAPDTIKLHNASIRTSRGNSSCIIVGCHSPGTPGAEHFWDYYSRIGITTTVVSFERVTYKGRRTSPKWCIIPSVLHEQRRVPSARIMAIDMDTLIDARRWCEMTGLGPAAPIVMNSLYRDKRWAGDGYETWGTMAQSNAMIAERGDMGQRAVKRWEAGFYDGGSYQDQSVINRREGDLCGVPGWVACHKNPHQQNCHCMGIAAKDEKDKCIENLFAGKHARCTLHEEMNGKYH